MKLLSIGLILLVSCSSIRCSNENEDSPSPVCDEATRTEATYQVEVSEILFQNCTYCHSTELASGGVVLDTYEDVAVVARNGQLLGAINHTSGFSPMPQNAPRLPSCEIEIIRLWIENDLPR